MLKLNDQPLYGDVAEDVDYVQNHVCNAILCGDIQGIFLPQHTSLPLDIASDKSHVQIVRLPTVRRSEVECRDEVRQ